MVKVGVDKQLFEILAAAQEKGLSSAELAEKTGIEHTLLSKFPTPLPSLQKKVSLHPILRSPTLLSTR